MAGNILGVKWGGYSAGSPGGTVTWSFANAPSSDDNYPFDRAISGDLQIAVRDAFARWSAIAQIDFQEVPYSADTDISIGFYDMDGNGPVWSNLSYSSRAVDVTNGDIYSNLLYARIFIDGAEDWSNARNNYSGGLPLYLAALKQIGSAIGLANSSEPGSVMNSILITETLDLSPRDISAARAIYGFRELPISPSEFGDKFTSTPADDIVDGRGGFDEITYKGLRSAFDIERKGDTIFVEGHGKDQLRNVEEIHFDDGTLSFDFNGNPGIAYRVYQAAFDRTPDTAGLSYWIKAMDGGNNVLQVAQGFVGSAEFQALYGTDPTNEEYIAKLYENVLGRPGEPAGLAYWLERASSQNLSKADLLTYFAASQENVAGVAPAIADGIWYV